MFTRVVNDVDLDAFAPLRWWLLAMSLARGVLSIAAWEKRMKKTKVKLQFSKATVRKLLTDPQQQQAQGGRMVWTIDDSCTCKACND